MRKHIFYGKEHDIFSVHKGFAKDEKFRTNIVVGDLVLDVSDKGRIRGIEILNATRFLKEFGINEKALDNLQDVKFEVSLYPESIIVGIQFQVKNLKHEISAKIAVPISEPAIMEQLQVV